MTQGLRVRQPVPWRCVAAMLAVLAVGCFGGPWPESSDVRWDPLPVMDLEHRLPSGPVPATFRFAVFGDQRALADGEWQRLVTRVASLAQEDPDLLFVIDTGDIVNSGVHTDQFAVHLDALLPLVLDVPYWVTVGNHELDNNRDPAPREAVGAFLSETDPALRPQHLYYDKIVGRVRILFLDTNDMVYPAGTAEGEAARIQRLEAQLSWLERRLSGAEGDSLTVVCMHHPFLQSSGKHAEQARELWGFAYGDRSLPDILLDGGTDLILTGHTHTYERFRVTRSDGKSLTLVNFSGRPRNRFLWFGASARRARDIRGREMPWLRDRGWPSLAGWTIVQEEAMVRDEANQFGVFTVSPSGLSLEVYYDRGEDEPWQRSDSVPLR